MGKSMVITWSDKIFNTVIYTVLTIIVLATLYPLIYVVSASLSDPMSIVKGEIWLLPQNLSLNAYRKVFLNAEIMSGYRNTVIYTVTGTAVNLIFSIMCAYPLSRKDFKGRNMLALFFSFTLFFNGGLIPTYLVYKQMLGLYNNLWVMIIPAAVNVWNMIIMRTYFQTTIPMEMQESASIDGCSNIGILLRIVLPLARPIIAVMVMYYGVAHWNAYFNALIFLKDRWRFPLQMIIRTILIQDDMQTMASSEGESIVEQLLLIEGMRYAVIVVSSVPMLMLYPFIQKYFVKGVMLGAVKG
jgi:putative aldouronate transport system permease protein